MSNVTPPGWYPDPWRQAAQRFWDGQQWTHRISGGSAAAVERPRLQDGAPINGPLIWILALLPVISGIVVWFFHPDFGPLAQFLTEVQNYGGADAPPPTFNAFSLYGPGYFVLVFVNIVVYAATVVLAYLDYRQLGRIGVVRPFHWAWGFLSHLVYLIGRSVVVYKVAKPRGLTPMWVGIAAMVAAAISGLIWSFVIFAELASQMSQAFPGN